MKVYVAYEGKRLLVGQADLPERCGPVHEVRLFGSASTLVERFVVGAVPAAPGNEGAPAMEWAVLAEPGQPVELLPGWGPLTL